MLIKILFIASWSLILLLTVYYQIKILQHIKDPRMNKFKVFFLGGFANKNVFDDKGKAYFFKYRVFGILLFLSAVFVIKILFNFLK